MCRLDAVLLNKGMPLTELSARTGSCHFVKHSGFEAHHRPRPGEARLPLDRLSDLRHRLASRRHSCPGAVRTYSGSMTTPSRERRFATSTGSHRVASRDSGKHVRLSASYESLRTEESRAVDAEDVAPNRGPRETDVWLTEWQVAEDGFDVALDQRVDWTLVPMDQDWVIRLFSGRRTVPLQRDTYAEATRDSREISDWTQLSGRVARIDQISVRYHPSEDPAEHGLVPETGGAVQHSVLSLRKPRAHHGQIVGWIVRVQGYDSGALTRP